MAKVKLQTRGKEIIEVDEDIVRVSPVLAHRMFMLTIEKDPEECAKKTVPVTHMALATFKKIVEWMTHHKDDPKDTESEKEIELDGFDAEFLATHKAELKELRQAAKGLGLNLLVDQISKVQEDENNQEKNEINNRLKNNSE